MSGQGGIIGKQESTFEWKEPPPISHRVWTIQRNLETLDELHAHPGKWALVMTDALWSQVAYWAKKHGLETRFEMTNRTQRRGNIYARWNELEASDE